MNNIDLAWAAGFIDGEACISLVGDRGTYTAVINVGQVVIEPLLELQKIFGGSVGPINDRFGGHFQWRVYGIKASNAAKLLIPYLRHKRNQAEILICYQETKGKQGQLVNTQTQELREKLFWQMKGLNKKRTLDAERLNEEAPQVIEDDAIVRSHANYKHETEAEMPSALA